ncbi:MAG: hypothetical protein WCD76_17810, partial [Pyrinomonadaceae bacterium]
MLAVAGVCPAQSGDLGSPTPIFSDELVGGIPARDIGDARQTRHFYTFRGREGDVTVTVESADLDGAVDVFTETTLRPLLKFTLFGGASKATKSVYLRKDETLILRVEARAAGDAAGSYRIHFGGAFLPAPANLAQASGPSTPPVTGNGSGNAGGVRRVTSTGARIEEPVAALPTKTDTGADTPPEGVEAGS